MNFKKSIILTLALLLAFIPTIAFAEAEIDKSILDAAKEIKESKTVLTDFAKPLSIYLVTEKEGSKKLDGNFKEGIRNSSDRTAVGVRDFTEAISGLNIFWNEEHRMVVIKDSKGKEVVLPIDKKVVFIDKVKKDIDVPATIDPKIGRTFLPLRTLAEALGYDVNYQPESHAAILVEPGYVYISKDNNKVPTLQDLLDPVNYMFTKSNENKVQPKEPEAPKINTSKLSINTKYGNKEVDFAKDIESELIRLINDYRSRNNLRPLQVDNNLRQLAEKRAAEFSINRSYTDPDGTPWVILDGTNGENQYVISPTENIPQKILDGWIKSKGHNENLLRPEFTGFDVSVVYDGHYLYTVVLFKQ